MAMYKGQLTLPIDKYYNAGALTQIVSLLEDSMDYSKCKSDEERKCLKSAIKLSLGKLNPTFSPRMTGSNFVIDSLLGFGSFGRIWKATGGKRVGEVALKQMPVDFASLPEIWKERDVLIKLKHHRICNLMGAFYETDVFLVLDLCYGSVGDLKKRISNANCYRFAVHLLEAIIWCHSNNIVHADIKPNNCLITTENKLVLSDFGSCVLLKDKQQVVAMHLSHGSPGYLDLQANKNLKFSKSTDVFSAACVIFEMDTSGYLLMYPNQDQHSREIYVDALENGRVCNLAAGVDPTDPKNKRLKREELPERAMCSTFSFILQEMIREKDRITAAEALSHPSMRQILNKANLSIATIDNESEYVTREFNLDRSYIFELFGSEEASAPELCVALASLYYDQDLSAEPAASNSEAPIKKEKHCVATSSETSEQDMEDDASD